MSVIPDGLACPKCGSCKLSVTDSRAVEGGIRRRRKCLTCDARFSTKEQVFDFLPGPGATQPPPGSLTLSFRWTGQQYDIAQQCGSAKP